MLTFLILWLNGKMLLWVKLASMLQLGLLLRKRVPHLWLMSSSSCCFFQNFVDLILWLIAIVLAVSAIALLSHSHFFDQAESPTVRALELVPFSEIPFPAVILAFDGNIKQMGLVEASKNMADESTINSEGMYQREG